MPVLGARVSNTRDGDRDLMIDELGALHVDEDQLL
jgi:hypothetical protein